MVLQRAPDRGSRVGDLSLVYPLARGLGPLLSVAVAIAVFGERPPLLALAGAGLVVAAVFSRTARARGTATSAAMGFAALTGTLIAAYTLWDAYAVDELGQPAALYLWGNTVTITLLLTPLAWRGRSTVTTAWRCDRRTIVGVAVLSPLAYGLVLVALALAPVSLVAPAREVSIVIGALLGSRLLGEAASRRRALAAVGIVAGLALLAA